MTNGGWPTFQLLRHRRNEPQAFLYAFDLLELNGTGLRREPIEVRKATAGEHPCARAGVLATTIRPPARATRPCRHARSRCTETAGSLGVYGRARAVAWRDSCAPRNDDRSASSQIDDVIARIQERLLDVRSREARSIGGPDREPIGIGICRTCRPRSRSAIRSSRRRARWSPCG